MGLGPAARALADDRYYDYDHHDHHVSTTEKIVAGALVAGLAIAAAKAIDKNRSRREEEKQREADEQRKIASQLPSNIPPSNHNNTRIVYIYDSRGTVPIYLRDLGDGSYVGPRGEYYGYLPSSSELTRTYGVFNQQLPSPPQRPSYSPLRATPIQGGVTISRDGRSISTCRTAMMNVERWQFANGGAQIVVKSRGNHGPATVEMFDTATGRLRDKVLAFAIRSSRVSWAYGFED